MTPEIPVNLCRGVIVDRHKRILLLYRQNTGTYECPGGVLDMMDCKDPLRPQPFELEKAASFAVKNELGHHLELEKLVYLTNRCYRTDSSRKVSSHAFMTRIRKGRPKVMYEEIFSSMEYLQLETLEHHRLAHDLKLFLPCIKSYVSEHQ